MQITLTANKSGLYIKFLERLKEAEISVKGISKKGYIPLPVIFEKVCRNFSIKKNNAWECLFLLRDIGLIELVRFRGVKLNYRIMKVEK